MKKRLMAYLLIIFILIAGILSLQQNQPVKSVLPHLPTPIAREKVLITPIGQGSEGLIVSELCDILNIRNNFLYWTDPQDLSEYNSLILVLGFSKQGLFSLHKTVEEEIERIKLLVDEANQKAIPIVLIHLGGHDRRGAYNDLVAKEVASGLSYIIVIEDGERDRFFTKLANENNIPITVINDVQALKVPLNSVYR